MKRRPKRARWRGITLLAAVTASLATVQWRQSTTQETLESLDRLDTELAVLADRQEELALELVGIERRPWVVAEAAERLGLRPASERETVIASGSRP
ncbi:MAG: hypothetical protein OXN18_05245 [Gemmatimonadota bacterium]|nr:hypothetical protein [Gemmatimonadota bacterium]